MWREIADVFVGNDVDQGLTVLADLQAEMDRRYDWLDAQGRRKIVAARRDPVPARRDRRTRLLLRHRRARRSPRTSSSTSPATSSPAAAPPA